MSIDENRKAFALVPWETGKNDELLGQIPHDPRENNGEKDRRQTVRQVWFCGVHTDVGGGYKQQGVSDIPLLWMVDRAVEHGLKLNLNHWVELNQNVEDDIHNERSTVKGKLLFRKGGRKGIWDPEKHGKLRIHESVLERKGSEKVPYKPTILLDDKEGYDIERWDNKGLEFFNYGLNIEKQYHDEFDSQVG
jgi:hypothetical protein